ncbi:hypothetical protein BDV3_000572 [Batrachochytrium dendrobatidis]
MTIDIAAAREYLLAQRNGCKSHTTAEPFFHDPKKVHSLGSQLLQHASALPTIEKFAIIDQVFHACIDTGHIEEAKDHLTTIEAAFPFGKSLRTRRLYGLYHEAMSDSTKAMEIYNLALDTDEASMPLWRQSVARLISSNQRPQAIEALSLYVDRFMQDVEGWTMLAKLYADEGRFEQAAFCLEEVLTLRPQHPLYRVRYAGIVSSLGRLSLAVKVYSAALVTLPDHVGALYGLRTVTKNILDLETVSNKKSSMVQTGSYESDPIIPLDRVKMLHVLAKERLLELYEAQGKSGQDMTSILKAWLHSQDH